MTTLETVVGCLCLVAIGVLLGIFGFWAVIELAVE